MPKVWESFELDHSEKPKTNVVFDFSNCPEFVAMNGLKKILKTSLSLGLVVLIETLLKGVKASFTENCGFEKREETIL